MRKILTLLAGLIFVVNYALAGIIFVAFLDWYDAGRWDINLNRYNIIAVSGVLCGSLALVIELWLLRQAKFWPRNPFLFISRLMAISVLYVALSFAISSLWTILTTTEAFDRAFSFLFIVPLMTMFYLPMMVPFGVVVGFINGALLRLTHTFHRY